MGEPKPSRSNRVTAVFQDATLLDFDLDAQTSLGELAVKIGKVARPHGGLSLPVHVRLAAGREYGNRQPLAERCGLLLRRRKLFGVRKRGTTFAASSLAL